MIQRLQEKRNEEGFTLIELLIVIIVLGILAAIVVFAVGSTRDDASASACNTDVKAAQLSAEAVKTKTGSYPANESGLVEPGGLLKDEPDTVTYTFHAAVAAQPAVDDDPLTVDVDETKAAVPASPAGYTIAPTVATPGCITVNG